MYRKMFYDNVEAFKRLADGDEALYDLIWGIASGYPLCCVAQYVSLSPVVDSLYIASSLVEHRAFALQSDYVRCFECIATYG